MKCPKCEGRGWNHNARYYNMGAALAYERGIEPSKKCRECGGSGFIIGNMADVLNHLKYLKNVFENERRTDELRHVEQCIKAIEL